MAGVGNLAGAVGSVGPLTRAVNSQFADSKNPQTPQVRIDTKRVGYLDLTRIIESIKRAMENEGDDTMQQFYQLFLGLMESRKAGTDPMNLLQELASAVHVQAPMQPGAMSGLQPQAPMMPPPAPSPGGNMGAPQQSAPQPGP